MSSFSDFLLQELWLAYLSARLSKLRTIDEHTFEINVMSNLVALRDSILRRYYQPSKGVAFIVHDPVVREIVAAPFRDRVVHHSLFNACANWWDRRFIIDSYSCRPNKGTLFGQQRLARHLRIIAQKDREPAFAVKLDIQGYFMSLRHKSLYERVLWGLNRQLASPENFPHCPQKYLQIHYQTLKYLWHQIIFDDPMTGIKIRGQRQDWHDLPPSKSLFNQPKGQGIVIGNLTSQLLSNIFLDQLDRFVVFELGYKHYGRYVDDFYIVVPMSQKVQLLRDIEVIRKFLLHELNLTLHPHKQYKQPAKNGVPFIGALVHPYHLIAGKRIRRNLYHSAYDLTTGYNTDPAGLTSRIGYLKHFNSYKLLKQVFDTYGWDINPQIFPQNQTSKSAFKSQLSLGQKPPSPKKHIHKDKLDVQ